MKPEVNGTLVMTFIYFPGLSYILPLWFFTVILWFLYVRYTEVSNTQKIIASGCAGSLCIIDAFYDVDYLWLWLGFCVVFAYFFLCLSYRRR